MANLKYSCISLGLGFLVILFSQVIASSPGDLLPPIPYELSNDFENDIVLPQVSHGTIPKAATETVKNDIILSEPKYNKDISAFDKLVYFPPPWPETAWMALYHAKNSKKNDAKTIPGNRRLLSDFGADIKLP